MTQSGDYSPTRLADRAAIHDCIMTWVRAVDRRRWDLVNEAFHADGYDDHGIYKGGVEGLVAWLSERHQTITHSAHVITNMMIEFASADTAVGETYCTVFQRYGSGGTKTRTDITGGTDGGSGELDMLMNGRYIDIFERRDSRWKIARRTSVFDYSTVLPIPANAPKFKREWSIGSRDSSDPLWRIRASVGLK